MIAIQDQPGTVSPDPADGSTKELQERLRAVVEDDRYSSEALGIFVRNWWPYLSSALADAARLEARCAEMERALFPFAQSEWAQDRWHPDIRIALRVDGTAVDREFALAGDFKRARKVLEGAARSPSSTAAREEETRGWIISNANEDQFRMWGDFGPEWTRDRDAALLFARRNDAEKFASEDENAWKILPHATFPNCHPILERFLSEDVVGTAMLDAWNEICSDTNCHPLDLTHQGRKLFFSPNHWARGVARRLFGEFLAQKSAAIRAPQTGETS